MSNRAQAIGAIVFTILIVTSLFAGTVTVSAQTATQFAGGTGTVEDPYQIGNWSQLDSVRDYPDANFTLVDDLNETASDYDTYANTTANGGAGWEPIGTAATPFSGSFDGDGNTVAGLRINRTTHEEAGLFGNTTGVTIERVTLDDVNVSDGSNASGLVGYATDVTITDVAVNGNVTGDSVTKFAGGAGLLAGYTVNATITNVTANGNVLTDGIAGGVVGYVVNGTVENASMNENPRGIATYEGVEANVLGRTAGGIVGSMVPQSDGGIFPSGSVIRNSTANATVVGQAFVGGLVGVGETVTGSTADGAVSGQAYTGGLTGLALEDVTSSVATGDVQRIFVENNGPEDTHGGLIGATDGNVTDSRATGNVASSNDNVGGLVGTVGLSALGLSPSADLRVVNSTATGDVDGDDSVGGLVGTVSKGDIIASTASGAVDADGATAGGLVGEFMTTGATKTYSIANSSASGAVNAASNGGGLVGETQDSIIENSTASGDTTVTEGFAGGLVAQLVAGTDVVDSSATGDVSANESYVGGLVGRVGEGNITDSDASGEVTVTGGSGFTSAEYIGGLAGGVESGSVTDSHASGEVTLVAGSGSGKFARVGGLIGNFGGSFGPGSSDFDGTLENSSASGDVTGPTIVGGLVGESAGSITDSRASGDVMGNGDVSQSEIGPRGNDTFGGLVGNVLAAGTVVTSTANGDVAARANVGGLVGVNSGSVTVSYATGAVAADSAGGGLVGGNGGAVNRTYAGGSVTGDGSGLVGFVFGDGNSANSYWDTETTGQSTSAGNATGLTTSQLKGDAATTNTALDFTTTWSVLENETYVSYPYLQANPQQPEPGLEEIVAPESSGGGSSSGGSSSSGGNGPQSVVSVSPGTGTGDTQSDDTDQPEEATDRKAVSVRNVVNGERVTIVLTSTDDEQPTPEGEQPKTTPEADTETGEVSQASPRNILPDGLDITFKQSGDFDLEVSSRDIDVFNRAMDDSEATPTPDLSVDALDDDSKRFVSETNQRPVGFIEVETNFDSAEVVQEATHKFRVRKTYLEATGASVDTVRLYRDEADGWRSLPTRQTDEDEAFYYFEADTPGFSVFAIGTSSPVFETGTASLDSFDETTGDVVATVPVENIGDVPGEFVATLTADGTVVATQAVTVGANEAVDVTVAGALDTIEPVTLQFAGQSISTATSSEMAITDANDGDDKASSGFGVSAMGLLLFVSLGLLLFFIVWRRRDDEEEEEKE